MKQKQTLQLMTVAELRRYARENRHLHQMTGVQIVSLSKNDLINNLLGNDDLPEPSNSARSSDLAGVIAGAVQDYINPSLDVDAVREITRSEIYDNNQRVLEDVRGIIADEIEKSQPQVTRIEVVDPETSDIRELGLTHCRFEAVLDNCMARIPTWMVGESGSGKSHLAKQVADAMGLDFYPMSVCVQTTKADLMGYMDVNGNPVRTALWDAYENGGVFLLDEADGGNPNVLMALNAALSNGWALFASRTLVQMHPDFICLAGANTYGKGADMVFVGRLKIDGATLNRFAFEPIDIDDDLEMALAQELGSATVAWCNHVQAIRKAVRELNEKVIVSPRATLYGSKMLSKKTYAELEDTHIWQGANIDVKNRVRARVNGGL